MIPQTLLSAILLAALILPGLVFWRRYERAVPAPARDQFRQVAVVLLASIVFLTVTGVCLAVVRALLPQHTVHMRALIVDPAGYFRGHYVHLTWWGIGSLLFAVVLAALVADPRLIACYQRIAATGWWKRICGQGRMRIGVMSAWQVALVHDNNGTLPPLVGAQMGDGTYVQGTFRSCSPSTVEDEHRELVLTAPLTLRTADGHMHDMPYAQTVLSARHITRLDVTYLTVKEPAPPAPRAGGAGQLGDDDEVSHHGRPVRTNV